MSASELLLSLLRYALCQTPIEKDVASRVDDALLGELYTLCEKQDVAPMVCYAASACGIVPSDAALAASFQKQPRLGVYRYERMNFEYAALCQTLQTAKIPYIPLKGAVIRPYYPLAWMRTSCDIDILVRQQDLERAIDVIVGQLGYSQKGEVDFHDVSLFSASGIHLELHHNILEGMSNIDLLLARVWEYAAPKSEGALEYVLDPAYLMFHCVAHMSYHFVHGGCGVRTLTDLYLLQKNLVYDRKVLVQMCTDAKLIAFYDRMVHLTHVWFDQGVHDELSLKTEQYILNGSMYGTTAAGLALRRTKEGAGLRYVLRRIFLPLEDMKQRYPVLNRHVYLLPVLTLYRWGMLAFSRSKQRHVGRELRSGMHMSAQSAENFLDFLQSVGLEVDARTDPDGDREGI